MSVGFLYFVAQVLPFLKTPVLHLPPPFTKLPASTGELRFQSGAKTLLLKCQALVLTFFFASPGSGISVALAHCWGLMPLLPGTLGAS